PPTITALRLLRQPRRGVSAHPVDEGKQVVGSPLLGDFSVRHAVHIDRIPPNELPRRGDSKKGSLVSSLDHRTHGHDVSLRDDVLLDIAQVRERGDDRADKPGEVIAALGCSEGTAVPLDVGRHEVRSSIVLVLVERRLDERANDPLVFLQVARGQFDSSLVSLSVRTICPTSCTVSRRAQSRCSSTARETQLTGLAPPCTTRSVPARCASTEVPPMASTTG